VEKGIKEKYINEFKFYLLDKNSAEGTTSTYIQNINSFLIWMGEEYISNVGITKISASDTHEYIDYLTHTRNQKSTTVNIKIFSLKSFFNFLYIKKYISINPAQDLKKIRNISKPSETGITDLDIKKLKKEVILGGNPLHQLIIIILCDTGIEVSELTNLKLSDIVIKENLIESYLVVKDPTSGNYKEISLSNDLIDAYNEWLLERNRRRIQSNYIVVSERSDHASRSVINKLLLKYSRKAGISNTIINPNALRKYYLKNNE
jgi:integrase/recombinase XerC